MSQYANYSRDSSAYDSTRVPFGLEIILGCLCRTGAPFGRAGVFEAGCGTGNYLQALQPNVGAMTGLDYSDAMLEQARSKVGTEVTLIQGSVLDLPLDDDAFDAVICNQVLHHLEEGPQAGDDPADWPASDFANIQQFFHEAHRVLRPDGVFVINYSTPAQTRDGFWWADLIPNAVERINCRIPELDAVQKMMNASGFDNELTVADLKGVLQGSAYFDESGPLRADWRSGDSTWTLTPAEELAAAIERVEGMTRDGGIGEFLAAREAIRRRIGQSTFVCGRK